MKKIGELSVFFPFWNEEENIAHVVESAIPILNSLVRKWEIVIIDDGSSDSTAQSAYLLAKKHKNIVVVVHKRNRGYGAALKSGFSTCKFDTVVFTDGDAQFDFSEVSKFLEKIDSADLVIGYRKKRHDHSFRHLLMNLLKIWDFIFFGFYFRDIDCGFKMFTREAIEKITPLESEGAMITTEILAKAKRAGLTLAEVEVHHFPRKFGDQSGGNFRVIFRAVIESLRLWFHFQYGKS